MRPKLVLLIGIAGLASWSCTMTSRPDLSGMSFSDQPLYGKMIWHDLITHDMDAAKRFYGGLFGWTFEQRKGRNGRDYAVARSGDTYVAGILDVDRPANGNHLSRWLPYMSVDDVDAAIERVVGAGGSEAVPPRNVPLGRVAAVRDPEGAVFGLARSGIGDPDDRTTSAAPGKVVWTELISDSPSAAAVFYGAVGGYRVIAVPRRGGTYRYLRQGTTNRAGILPNPSDNWEPVWLTYFGVDDPAAAAAKARSLGGRIVLQASPEVREGSMAIVTDPSGAVLVLQQWDM
jgi:predicted enzyme related to lactoylglutathione lyase